MFLELVQAAQNQPITPATLPESLHFGTQITAGAVSVFIIQRMKSWSALPWISHWTPMVNRVVAVISAALTAVGVHFAYSAVDHTVIISGLTLTGVLGMLWVWVKQFALQEYVYQSAANRTKVVPAAGAALEVAPPQLVAKPGA
jgi:hypothetical protein